MSLPADPEKCADDLEFFARTKKKVLPIDAAAAADAIDLAGAVRNRREPPAELAERLRSKAREHKPREFALAVYMELVAESLDRYESQSHWWQKLDR